MLHDLVHVFAGARLSDAARETARQCHAHYYTELVEAAQRWLHGLDEQVWLDRLEAVLQTSIDRLLVQIS
jgi:hypothetical protein